LEVVENKGEVKQKAERRNERGRRGRKVAGRAALRGLAWMESRIHIHDDTCFSVVIKSFTYFVSSF
jgi:hypothetical protein